MCFPSISLPWQHGMCALRLSNSLCGWGVSGSGESDWPGTFCERCGGRSTDCSGMWNPELLGDIKSEEKVRYHEDWKRKRCSDFTGTDRVIF